MLGLDGRSFAGNLNKAQVLARTAGKNISDALGSRLAGLLGTAAMAKLTHDTIQYASKINDLSQRLGVGTEKLQEFGFAAQQNGSNLDAFATFIERVNVSREAALEGNEKAIESFKELGVTIDDLKGKRVQELTNQIANKVKDADIQKIIAPLREIGGRGAGELVAAFKAGLEDAGDAARESGVVMSQETIEQLDAIGDRFDLIGLQLKTTLAPALVTVADSIQAFIDHIRRIGAVLGALTSNVDSEKLKEKKFDFLRGGAFGELFRQLKSGSVEAEKALAQFDENIVKREEGAIKAREVAKQVRDAQTQGDFDLEAGKKKKGKKDATRAAGDVSDLQRVGAFISNPNQTLEKLSQSQEALLKQIAKNTDPSRQKTNGRGVMF